MKKAFHAVSLAIVGLLAYIAATPYLTQDRAEQFYERAVACLADALVPSADAAAFGPVDAFTPAFGGRCTLTSVTPVMTASVASATTVYYTPYIGNRIAVPTSTGKLVNWVFPELTNISTNSAVGSAGPAAVAVSSVYDLYVWQCTASTLCLTRSPAWATAVTRGTGAATAQIDCTTVPGVCTNAVAITNGPAANRGTYVGTAMSDIGSTFDWQYGTTVAGGGQATFGVWNQYNRVNVSTIVGETANSWTYATTTVRPPNGAGGVGMRVTFATGFQEDVVSARYSTYLQDSATTVYCTIGIGVDVTNAFSAGTQTQFGGDVATVLTTLTANYVGSPGIGSHFLQALEYASAATCTFYGDNNAPTLIQTVLGFNYRM